MIQGLRGLLRWTNTTLMFVMYDYPQRLTLSGLGATHISSTTGFTCGYLHSSLSGLQFQSRLDVFDSGSVC